MLRCKHHPRLIVLCFVIVLLSLSGLPTQSPQTIALAATDNLIVNAGFEEGNFSPSNPPAGWSTLQYHPGGA